MSAPRFLTLSDVAEELQVSLSQVRALVRSGELPAIQIGGRNQWRIERTRFEEYINEHGAQRQVAGGQVGHDQAHAEEVVDLGERDVLVHHLAIDGVERFFAGTDLGLHAHSGQCLLDGAGDAAEGVASGARDHLHGLGQRPPEASSLAASPLLLARMGEPGPVTAYWASSLRAARSSTI